MKYKNGFYKIENRRPLKKSTKDTGKLYRSSNVSTKKKRNRGGVKDRDVLRSPNKKYKGRV